MIGRLMNIYIRKPVMFTVTWKANGSVIKTEQVEFGDSATPPNTSSITPPEGHTFKGWDKSYSNIRANTEINATWSKKPFTVKFYNRIKQVVSTQTVLYGENAVAPIVDDDGYDFVSWDKPFTNVRSNLDIYSNWSPAIKNLSIWRVEFPTYEAEFPSKISANFEGDGLEHKQYVFENKIFSMYDYLVKVGNESVPVDCIWENYGHTTNARWSRAVNELGRNIHQFVVKSGDRILSYGEINRLKIDTTDWIVNTTRDSVNDIGIIYVSLPGQYLIATGAAKPNDILTVSYYNSITKYTAQAKLNMNISPILPMWSYENENNYMIGFDIKCQLKDMRLSFAIFDYEAIGGGKFRPRLKPVYGVGLTGDGSIPNKKGYTVVGDEIEFNGTVLTNIDDGSGGKLKIYDNYVTGKAQYTAPAYIKLPANGKWHTNGSTEVIYPIPVFSSVESTWGIRCTLNK